MTSLLGEPNKFRLSGSTIERGAMTQPSSPAEEEYLQAIYTLQDEGAQVIAADRITRRHRLAERMLVDLLGYAWWKTHEEAERIEHAMSDEMEERLMTVLGNPETCPHGNPMPGVTPRPTRTLESLAPGTSSPVERIPDQFEHEPGFLEYLDGVGIKPKVAVTLVSVDDASLRIAIDGQERSVRRDCGRKVLVAA